MGTAGRMLVLTGGLALLASCGERKHTRRDPTDEGGGDTTSTSSGGGGEGGEGGAMLTTAGIVPGCNGVCVKSVPVPFERLAMFSIGTPDTVRPCSDLGSSVGFEGFADLKVEPHACGECQCSPATCVLPEAMHVSAAKCSGNGSVSTPWNAPPSWEGVCTAEGAIPAGLMCEGDPCTQSITISAAGVDTCKPIQGESKAPPAPEWGTMARECLIDVTEPGCEIDTSCVPVPPEGFSICLFMDGDHLEHECPAEYPRQLVVFDGVDDSRGCAPCDCGKPEGLDCAAFVSVFTDAECGAPLGMFLVSAEDGCHDLPSGSALGSKEAWWAVDKPGTCSASGGATTGTVEPT